MNEVTRILSAIDGGDPQAAALLLPLVYEELRKLAAQRLAHERPGQTLQATSLVHEAYLRLVGSADADAPPRQFSGRAHFFAAAAEAMRRVVVDSARRKQSEKHGGGRRRVVLDDSLAAAVAPSPAAAEEDLLALDAALEKLEREDKTKADLVKLHHFTGLSLDEAADALAMSRATAYRYWTYARAWLGHEVRREVSRHKS